MIPLLIMAVGSAVTVYVMVKYLCPFTNRFFALIWREPDIEKNDIAERIKALYVDGDVPEETALMMASVESGQSKESILGAFNAANAIDLANIIKKKPREFNTILSQLMESGYKKNMR